MIETLYQDDHLLVVNKPAGWLVHPTPLDRHESRVVLRAVRAQVGRLVWPLHRLDKGTSGVLAFAFDRHTAGLLGVQFDQGSGLLKHYRAIVRGLPPDELRIDHPLRRLEEDNRPGRVELQEAATLLRTIRRGELPVPQGRFPRLRWAEVELEPLTGRRHQLRRHMKHIAHPIMGDATHGKGPINRAAAGFLGENRLWLHAGRLAFSHPWTHEALDIVALPGASWEVWSAPGPPGGLDPQTRIAGSTE
jgi:tRNA pseudouridine65 synthase